MEMGSFGLDITDAFLGDKRLQVMTFQIIPAVAIKLKALSCRSARGRIAAHNFHNPVESRKKVGDRRTEINQNFCAGTGFLTMSYLNGSRARKPGIDVVVDECMGYKSAVAKRPHEVIQAFSLRLILGVYVHAVAMYICFFGESARDTEACRFRLVGNNVKINPGHDTSTSLQHS